MLELCSTVQPTRRHPTCACIYMVPLTANSKASAVGLLCICHRIKQDCWEVQFAIGQGFWALALKLCIGAHKAWKKRPELLEIVPMHLVHHNHGVSSMCIMEVDLCSGRQFCQLCCLH